MVSTLSRQEKFNQARRNFCFYLDIQDQGLCRSISRRLQDMGLQQEACLSGRVTHVVRDSGAGAAPPRWRRDSARTRADAMLDRVRHAPTPHNYVLLSVEKAIALLDKLYDTFFAAPRKSNVRLFTKHYIKIEFLDKQCRPLYKEFDAWPEISLEPNPERKEKKEPPVNQGVTVNNNYQNTIEQNREMTRKNNRPRIKEKEDKEPLGGYCEACGAMFADLAAHARSPRHAAFARDTGNFLALDSLIGASFLPVNGERRSLRNVCNGELDPRRVNGALDDEPRRTRCRKTDSQEDRQYYKVVGVSTKLRSSGGFVAKRKDSSPTCNGAKPLVVKFRKVRRSELSVLSDEAEQFMFPKRASSTSSTSSDDDDDDEDDKKESPRRKTPPQPAPALERRRQARPTALKEESSEEDSWLDDKRRRKRRVVPVVRRTRRAPCKPPTPEPEPPPEIELPVEKEPVPDPEPEVSPLREEPVEKCMKWEDGRLKYTPAVEQLEFAFESVPRSEPWFETFTRQDHDQVSVKNVPRCFALYSKSPKLPYEIGQLPPLKPDCCALSNLPRPAATAREPRSERYGTRGLKSRKLHKRIAAIAAQDSRPRKSPREHASTLAMLGSAGLHRRGPDDAKSTASEDTVSDALSAKPEPSEAQEADERLQKFLSEVFDDAAEFELDEVEGGALPAAAAPPDVLGLVSECDGCDIIRNEIAEVAERRRARRRGRFKKKNKTGWPNKRKSKKGSRTNSSEKTESSLDRSSVASGDTADDTCDEDNLSEIEGTSPPKVRSEDEREPTDVDRDGKSDDKPLRLDVKVLLEDEKKAEKVAKRGSARSSASEEAEERGRKKKRALSNLASWLQPVVRVARVDAAARRLRSAAKPRQARLR
ncbi:serine/arginine repetitive matrix protein 1 isoform X1 [Cydia fagiglandana]|uniref:serine/arginine repetitive matrix protein 1 isoform X1 n=2 Tax=Cydia fagiglandana TaxID=1458189 RepID=UPI002FEDFCD4